MVPSLSSCSNIIPEDEGSITFIKKSYDYLFDTESSIKFDFYMDVSKNVQKITSVRFLSDQEYINFVNDSNIPIAKNGKFSIDIFFSRKPNKKLRQGFGLVFEYTDQNGKLHFEKVESSLFYVIYDLHQIVLNDVPNNIVVEGNKLLCNLIFLGDNVPETINYPQIATGANLISIDSGQDKIFIDPNTHSFQMHFTIIDSKKNYAENLSFSFTTTYDLFGKTQFLHSDIIDYKSYKNKISIISQSNDYLFNVGDKLRVYYELVDFETLPTKIDKAVLLNEESNYLQLLSTQDIAIDTTNNSFVLEFVWSKPTTDIETFVNLDMIIEYKYENIKVLNRAIPQVNLRLINETPYDGTKVRFFALEDGSFRLHFWFNPIGGQQGHYSINGASQPQWLFCDRDIQYSKFDSIEIWSDCIPWWMWEDPSNYGSLIFSGRGTIAGDITSLIDNQGGNITELTGDLNKPYIFNGIFGGDLGQYQSKIIKVSENFLPCTNVPAFGYYKMFTNNVLLEQGPNLPATDLEDHSYDSMFSGCTNLVSISNNILPATIVPKSAYYNMFYQCVKFDSRIDIEGVEFEAWACSRMFYRCGYLSSIKIAYTGYFDIFPGQPAFGEWVLGVHKQGTIYYNGNDQSRGISSIPEGWTILSV